MIHISIQFFGGNGSKGSSKKGVAGGGAGGAKAPSQTVPSTVAAVESEITQKFKQTEYANVTEYSKALNAENQKYNDARKKLSVDKTSEKYEAADKGYLDTNLLQNRTELFMGELSDNPYTFKQVMPLVHPQSLKQFGLDMNNPSNWEVDYYKDTKTWRIWNPKKNLQPGDIKTILFDKDLNLIGTQAY